MKEVDYTGCSTLEEFRDHGKSFIQGQRGEEDYSAYLDKLEELAKECSSYRELGTFQGLSAACVILANPSIEVSLVDIDFSRFRPWMHLFPEVDMHEGDSREAPQKDCDLLFIDSRHNPQFMAAELMRHGGGVRKFVMAHDTADIKKLRAPLELFAQMRPIHHDGRSAGFSVIEL
jgi:hypothetical protein